MVEKYIIATLLDKPEVYAEVSKTLSAKDFRDPSCSMTFKLIEQFIAQNKHIDAPLMVEYIFDHHLESYYDNFTSGFFADLISHTVPVSFLFGEDGYVQKVKEKSDFRTAKNLIGRINAFIDNPPLDPDTDKLKSPISIVAEGLQEIIQTEKSNMGVASCYDVALKYGCNFGEKVEVASSGFSNLDSYLNGGFERGNLYVLAARPSMGKTAFALNVMLNMALKGKRIMFFSLEMKADIIVEILSGIFANLEMREFKQAIRENPNSRDEDFQKFFNALDRVSKCDIVFRTDNDSLDNMMAAARIENSKKQLDLVVIDHLQLISAGQRSEYEDVRKVSKEAKRLAMSLNVPVLILSQLNRSVESRDNKRPSMSDLRGNGSIEQDADVVSFLYRDSYYYDTNPDGSPVDPFAAELIVAKNRFGPTGRMFFNFIIPWQKFIGK